MDQGAFAIRRNQTSRWTPARVLLLVLGIVVLGVALSLLLGSSPAHAAESDDPGSSGGLLGGVSTAVDQTVAQAATDVAPAVEPVVQPVIEPFATSVVAPLVQQVDESLPVPVSTAPVAAAVSAAASRVVAASPAVAAVVAPVLSPVTGALQATLGSLDQVVPAAHGVTPSSVFAIDIASSGAAIATHAVAAIRVAGTAIAMPILDVPAAFPSAPALPGSGSTPASAITSSPTVPVGVLGLLFTLAAFALLGARRRSSDDALPASPVFDTDTSPA